MRYFVAALFFIIALFLVFRKGAQTPVSLPHQTDAKSAPVETKPLPSRPSAPTLPMTKQLALPEPLAAPAPISDPKSAEKPKRRFALPYKMEDGLVVVQGDLVLGKPKDENMPENGIIEPAPLQFWDTATFAYFIQPSLPSPDRVKKAIALFDGTPIKFIEYANQTDALVFVEGSSNCKSYVGKVGGRQPIWLSPSCGPHEIAHEIMHALGFIHEQNRFDRDDYIDVLTDHIDENFKDNFIKLPPEFMKVSGLGTFDFESMMIYPVWMFVKGGQATMESKQKDKRIEPSFGLSSGDRERLQKFFAHPN